MPDDTGDLRLERAVGEFQQYLSDLLPPLVIADSVELLINCPPELTATNIYSWATGQTRSGRSISVSDFLYHAMKKLHLMGEYHLIPAERLTEFLRHLKPIIVSYCPEKERSILQENLEHLGKVQATLSSPVEVVYRQSGAAEPGRATSSSEESAKEVDILSLRLLMQRIERELGVISNSGEGDSNLRQQEVVSEALAQAARSARVSMELERALEQLQKIGVKAGTEDVFRALGRSLPEWSFATPPGVELPEDSNLKAMRRIVSQAGDSKESGSRFHQMVSAATERFNEGHLSQSVSMIELAEKIIEAKEVEEGVSRNVKKIGHERLDFEQLRKYSENPEDHAALRRILNFFDGLTPQGLFDSLRREPKRDRRRLYLALLESHGSATRKAAIEALKPLLHPNATNEEVYFRRNLLYLLRRIPADASESQDELSEIAARHASLQSPKIILKEAIMYLGQIRHEKAERALVRLLAETEELLLSQEESLFDVEELLWLLDRTCSALTRQGTASSHRTLIDHALKRKPKLGDTLNRLTELGTQDLSSDPLGVDRLLAALKENLPSKFLGKLLAQKADAKPIIEALSGTSIPKVRQALKEVSMQYEQNPIGQAAAAALVKQSQLAAANASNAQAASAVQSGTAPHQPSAAAAEPQKRGPLPASSLEGDLDFFGLPALFQSLGDNAVTGTLSLKDRDGSAVGDVRFREGKVADCRTGKLSGETAFYQLLEKPIHGTFHFVRQNPSSESEEWSREVLPLILEGIRRYDEFGQARSILPDDAKVISKSGQPKQLPEERDGMLFRELWNAVTHGATPSDCETTLNADAYRIRRLLVHWVENGCIEITI